MDPTRTRTLGVATLALTFLATGISHANHLGTWEGPYCLPNVGTHMIHLHTGQILLWPGHGGVGGIDAWLWNIEPQSQCFTGNPNPGFDPQCIQQVNNDETNLFCSSHAPLDDGTILATGGHNPAFGAHVGLPDANLFDPEKVMWTGQDDGVAAMTYNRWYPTSTTLPDGRILTVSGSERRCDGGDHNGDICSSHASCSDTHGSCVSDICEGGDQAGNACGGDGDCLNNTGTCDDVRILDLPEIYDPATQTWSTVNASKSLPFYPLMFLLPDGTIFYAGAEDEVGNSISTLQNYVLDLGAMPPTWTFVAASTVNGGSGVMYEPGKILKSGGRNGGPALDGAQTINLNQMGPTWMNTATPMSAPRVVHSSTLLPDGTVLITGGTRHYNREYNNLCVGGTRNNKECSLAGQPSGDSEFPCATGHDEENCPDGTCTGGDGTQQWVSQAELYDPATNSWTPLAHMKTPRQYHSNAMLLPDGRVAVAGGGQGGGSIHNYSNYEIFSPPYLTNANGPAPVITQAPPWFSPGEHFSVGTPDPGAIDKASLIRLAASTHGFDQNQRYIPLDFEIDGGNIKVKAALVDGAPTPFNHNVVPPGYYMLFLLSEDGNSNLVPSEGRYIRMLGDTPIAQCMDVDTTTDPGLCTAAVSIDDGSFDPAPADPPLTLEQTPASPYPVGTTEVSLMVTDANGLSDMCQATVMVTDDEPPVPMCNAPANIVPPDASISFTATAADNCGVDSVVVFEPDCFKFTKKGKRIDKTSSCVVFVAGDTITIDDVGGVNTHIAWKISVVDVNGNAAEGACEVIVANPGNS